MGKITQEKSHQDLRKEVGRAKCLRINKAKNLNWIDEHKQVLNRKL